MTLRNTTDRYGAVARTLHWAVAALVVAGWLLGTFGDALPKGAPRTAGLFAHMWIGLTVLALLTMRVAWRLSDRPPPPAPTRLGPWGDRGAALAHLALYLLLAAVPAVGIVVEFAGGHALSIFGLWHIPSPWSGDRAFERSVREVHEVLADALVIIAAVHAAAALVHHFVLGDRVLRRMLPGRAAGH